MNFTRRFPAKIQLYIITQKVRFFVRDPFPNKLTQYLRRAELIDSIRLCVRSNPDSLPTLLHSRLLDPFVVTHAIRCTPNADSAIFLVESLKTLPHFSHNQSTLYALATVLAKSRRSSELKFLIADIDAGKYWGVRISFMNLMQWHAACGEMDAVLDSWDKYRKSGKRLCTESYNIVMQLYGQKGQHLEAVKVFFRLIDEGAVPNSRTYTVMIEHLTKLGKLDPALEIFRILPLMRIKRTLKQYSVLVEGLAGAKRFGDVKMLLHEIRVDGKFPGRPMLLALQCLQEAGFLSETEEFIQEMLPDKRIRNIASCEDSSDEDEDEDEDASHEEVDGIPRGIQLKRWLDPKALAKAVNEMSPDVVSALEDAKLVWTNRLVCKVLRNFTSPDRAWDFFCWVACQPGFTHDIHTIERMMAAFAQHGKADMVDRLIAKIRSEGLRLSFSTIKLIIDFYGISKNADAALKVFHDDRGLCGPISKFNLMLLYSSLLRTLTKCRRNSDAMDMLDEMISSGIRPDSQTFSGLMYHFALEGDMKTVQKLFLMVRQSCVKPDAYMFKVLIQAYCKSGRAALAWRVFEDMKNSNLLLDVATKDLLVKSLWKEGKRKEAASLEESCEEFNETLPLVLQGHVWTVSSVDLTTVYQIYANSFVYTND
ncbi:hypothetical protein K2173_005986 [Erythroxylum novogranatense]|uniref:Pentatricopeptide repeat-containing protein n=1 Tax=Erythroxylum novogranatense TaxID=1862640 RepID=A0AAV8TBM6_9ROSI|nr:hypothetical protein K2173_005986 [Erythroxylum novogranatense]